MAHNGEQSVAGGPEEAFVMVRMREMRARIKPMMMTADFISKVRHKRIW